ncbi:Blue-light photoreceptor PHR2 [Galdieria sulphuraria]|uniref:Photolyase/blue-light receptor (PHR2) n=1 Tax=Galdieria sulphuraria TaxID=130081 RepID=M2W6Q9_GALSU|nr:photolyase/blue-light receptor (PHR2) [Galdieria sulphuraria]EME31471.1 photolyase/blue-light receptor (PHR2) [Galdieria sulphuraria]GJD06624.1 Blue-light photoreceptor PHR2 [Galdieria sulphuraria]|eukprot:XP_005707991.1 photolyase/blue-light receptor (PHR2) [Galdieria sulphuraria]
MNAFVSSTHWFRVQQKPVVTSQSFVCGSSGQQLKRLVIRKSSLKPFIGEFRSNCISRYNGRNESNVLDQPVPDRLSQGAFKRPWFFGGAPRRILVWFFADLRVQDNEALIKAVQNGSVPGGLVLPLVALHQEMPRSAVVELKTELQRRGSDLCVLPKFSTESVLEVCHKYGIEAIYYNHAELPDQIQLQTEMITDLESKGIQVEGFWSNTLVSPDQFANLEISDMGFRKFSQEAKNVKVSQPLSVPNKLPHVPEDIPRLLDNSVGTYGFSIAESTAWSLLETHQKNSCKESDGAFIFRLKPYLDHGCISPRNLFDSMKEMNNKHTIPSGMFQILYAELLWRSYVTFISHQRIKVKSHAIHSA